MTLKQAAAFDEHNRLKHDACGDLVMDSRFQGGDQDGEQHMTFRTRCCFSIGVVRTFAI
jgi:hypothetical protein